MENKVTVREAAAILGISPRRVHALIEGGRIPVERFGNVFAIKESDLALVSDRKAGRPKKEGAAEDVQVEAKGQTSKGKRWKAEQQTLPEVVPVRKKSVTKPTASRTKAVAVKKSGKK